MTAANYDFTVAVGKTASVEASGRFCYYLAGSAGGMSERIRVKHPASGLSVLLMPGQAFELPGDAPFGSSAWRIENADGQAKIVGVLVIGSGSFKDNRLMGAVSVVDGGKIRTMAGMAFSGALGCAGVAGQVSHVQLWNPAGSGVNVFVESLLISTSSVGSSAVAVACDNGTAMALSWKSSSKQIGGTASNGQLRSGSNALAQAGSMLLSIVVSSSAPQLINFREPVQIPQARGLVVLNAAQGNDIQVNFESFEEAV